VARLSGTPHAIAEGFARLLERLSARRRDRRLRGDKLRDYEWALLNIKTLGYELARLTASARIPSPPAVPAIAGLKSKLCTQADIESAWLAFWCAEIGVKPLYVRKLWEFCYAAQALWDHGMLAPGRSGIGFGCGREPLPSLLAKYGCDVLATDLPRAAPLADQWLGTEQRATDPAGILYPKICPEPLKLARIRLCEIDMNRIPEDLADSFDFCWSCCALEHLGSLVRGADFIENSLRVLKPGGVAVHTTEFNLSETGEAIEKGGTVLYQRRHIAAIADRLSAQGHTVAELDFAAGDGVLDGFVDLPPFDREGLPADPHPLHLKVSLWGFRCTSFGLIVKRAG
jgi:SAM-dependent methyltransferase